MKFENTPVEEVMCVFFAKDYQMSVISSFYILYPWSVECGIYVWDDIRGVLWMTFKWPADSL